MPCPDSALLRPPSCLGETPGCGWEQGSGQQVPRDVLPAAALTGTVGTDPFSGGGSLLPQPGLAETSPDREDRVRPCSRGIPSHQHCPPESLLLPWLWGTDKQTQGQAELGKAQSSKASLAFPA